MLAIITARSALLWLLLVLALEAWRPNLQHVRQPSSGVLHCSLWGAGHGFMTPYLRCCTFTKQLTGKGHGDSGVQMEVPPGVHIHCSLQKLATEQN